MNFRHDNDVARIHGRPWGLAAASLAFGWISNGDRSHPRYPAGGALGNRRPLRRSSAPLARLLALVVGVDVPAICLRSSCGARLLLTTIALPAIIPFLNGPARPSP